MQNETYEYTAPDDTPKRYWLHILLFCLTLITTAIAGAEMVTNHHFLAEGISGLTMNDFWKGFPYAFAFLGFLATHEFGHYFTAVYHRVKCSLPYFIPIFVPYIFPINIGSFGAVIRLKQVPDSNIKYFDIGIAGPLAGFVVAVGLLIYGFLTLPPLDYLYEMNPNYHVDFGRIPSEDDILRKYGSGLLVGNSLLFYFFEQFIANPAHLPNHFELIHYPALFVGYITLFFTALNLLPIGQLDGGHITYGLFGGEIAGYISRAVVIILLVFGGLGLVDYNDSSWAIVLGFYLLFLFFIVSKVVEPKQFTLLIGIVGGILLAQYYIQHYYKVQDLNLLWLFYSFIAVRLIKLDHPPALKELPLTFERKVLGYLALAILILCFSPNPIRMVFYEPPQGIFTMGF